LQVLVSVRGILRLRDDTHAVPLLSASDILFLVLSLVPPPQVTEQPVQEPQGPTLQSTGVLQSTLQLKVCANSMILNLAHFSPLLCASANLSLVLFLLPIPHLSGGRWQDVQDPQGPTSQSADSSNFDIRRMPMPITPPSARRISNKIARRTNLNFLLPPLISIFRGFFG